jgi:hypothetical protein
MSLYIDFTNSRMAFPTGSRAHLVAPDQSPPGLYRSHDAGQTFAHPSSLPFGAIAVDPTNPDSGHGLFKSTDGGQTLQSHAAMTPRIILSTFGACSATSSNSGVVRGSATLICDGWLFKVLSVLSLRSIR